MGAIVAKTLNSTLGTKNFESLDKLLYRQKRMCADMRIDDIRSNPCFMVIPVANKELTVTTEQNTGEVELFSFKSLIEGTFRFKLDNFKLTHKVTTMTNDDSYYFGINVYKNQKLIQTYSDAQRLQLGHPRVFDRSIYSTTDPSVIVSYNDIITFKFFLKTDCVYHSSNWSLYFSTDENSLFEIYTTIVDNIMEID